MEEMKMKGFVKLGIGAILLLIVFSSIFYLSTYPKEVESQSIEPTSNVSGIRFHPRYWDILPCFNEDSCHINFTEDCNEIICLEDITDYLDITWDEISITGDEWKFEAEPAEGFFDNYILEQLEDMPCEGLTDGIEIECEFEVDKLKIKVKFKEGWKTEEMFKIGYKTITYVSSTNIITVVGDATCGDAEANSCGFQDIYNADKTNNYTILDTTTGAIDLDVDNLLRPTDNITIPVVLNISNLTIGSAHINITGTIFNNSVITETVIVTDNITYTTSWYWKNISMNGIDSNTSAINVSIHQSQWGCWWKSGNTEYASDCRIIIGDGSTTTWFKDNQKAILIKEGMITANGQNFIYLKRYANFIMGLVYDATNKITYNGVSFIAEDQAGIAFFRIIVGHSTYAWDIRLELYSCYFSSIQPAEIRDCRHSSNKVWNSLLDYRVSLYPNIITDTYNVVLLRGTYAVIGGTQERVEIFGTENALYDTWSGYSPSVTFKNFLIVDADYIIRPTGDIPVYIINADTNTWAINWHAASTSVIYRQYEFDLNVTDEDGVVINGATVDVNSTSDDVLCFNNVTTTGSSGGNLTQTMTIGYYNQVGGDAIYDCNPYRFIIQKTGYQTLNFTANITEKTEWVLPMIAQPTKAPLGAVIHWFGGYREVTKNPLWIIATS